MVGMAMRIAAKSISHSIFEFMTMFIISMIMLNHLSGNYKKA